MNARAQRAADLAACYAAIRTGSHSFHAASRLLPARLRDRAIVLYAFCRMADDAVDDSARKPAAVARLHARLDAAYSGQPCDAAADRAFARLLSEVDLPRALPDALIEGFAWDADARHYDDFSSLCGYCARVASSVGAMMCVLMDVRDPDRLARACDLGLAMQLTNIARDVGQDARAGRLYLPLSWLDRAGIDPDRIAQMNRATPELRAVVSGLLARAEEYYRRSEPGIAALPPSCRPAIMAARLVYGGIGGALAQMGHDSIRYRARSSRGQKLRWLALAGLRSAAAGIMPLPATLHAPATPETQFLVSAAARASDARDRSDTLMDILTTLRARDIARRGIDGGGAAPI